MIITLNDNWTFFKGTAAPAVNKAQAPAQASAQAGEKVTLPHTWNAIDGQDGGSDYFRGECTYTRPLPALTLKEDEEAYLCFYGVSQTAEVLADGGSLHKRRTCHPSRGRLFPLLCRRHPLLPHRFSLVSRVALCKRRSLASLFEGGVCAADGRSHLI